MSVALSRSISNYIRLFWNFITEHTEGHLTISKLTHDPRDPWPRTYELWLLPIVCTPADSFVSEAYTSCYRPKPDFIVIEIPGQNLIFCAGATGVQTIGNNHNYCLSSAHQLQHKILTRYFNYNKIRLRWVTASIRLTNKRVTRVNVTKIITVKSRTFLGLMPKGG